MDISEEKSNHFKGMKSPFRREEIKPFFKILKITKFWHKSKYQYFFLNFSFIYSFVPKEFSLRSNRFSQSILELFTLLCCIYSTYCGKRLGWNGGELKCKYA